MPNDTKHPDDGLPPIMDAEQTRLDMRTTEVTRTYERGVYLAKSRLRRLARRVLS